MKASVRRWVLAAVAVAVAALVFSAGVHLGTRGANDRPSFHDMRVNHVAELTALVDPDDPAVRALAEQLGAPEAAYAYVRDRIRYESRGAAAPPGEIIRDGSASCLGKATLLCSLYRSLGMPPADVRIVTGNVVVADRLADHAWIDLEYNGTCLQQDPSGFLGKFEFGRFRDAAFSRTFVVEEDYCFNEEGLAVVSQLNRFRNGLPGGAGETR